MLRVIRFLLFIAALMIAVYQANAQDVPPPPFILHSPASQNPDLFRMDYTVGCGTAGLSEHYLILACSGSQWNPMYPNTDTTDRVTYEYVFRVDSALADGSFIKIERSVPSNQNGTSPVLSLSGQEVYDLLWTDGVPVRDRTDSLVMEVQYYVVATCTNHGLKTYSDTAGVSLQTADVPHVTPPLVVSINRPPVGPTDLIVPMDNDVIYNIESPAPFNIIWNEATDINTRLGKQQGLFKTYNDVTKQWETVLNPGTGIPARTIDTITYQWYGVVTEAWPKPSPVTGMALVKTANALNAIMIDVNDLDALFQGLNTNVVDSIRIQHCILAKDAMFYGTPTVHGIFFPYRDGIWQNGLMDNPESDTLLYSEFGCAPHIIKGACATLTLKKGGTTSTLASPEPAPQSLTLSAYPNPMTSTTAITYNLPERGNSRLAVYDMLGREAALLHEGLSAHGTHTVQWSPPAGLPRGNYMIVLTADGQRISTPIVIHQ